MIYFKKSFFILLTVQLGLSYSWSQEIVLPTNKTLVVPIPLRQTVLEVGESFLEETSEELKAAFKSSINPVQNPFTPQDELVPPEVVAIVPEVETKQAVAVVYDDAAVLTVVASSLSQQIRGTLSRGNDQFLQLQGGTLLKSGSNFPARIPGTEGQGTYNVQVEEVTASGITLRLGDSTLYVPILNE